MYREPEPTAKDVVLGLLHLAAAGLAIVFGWAFLLAAIVGVAWLLGA